MTKQGPKSKVSSTDVDQAPTGEKPENADKEMPRSDGRPGAAQDSKSREERVREAAYRRFEERGSAHGQHEEDWRAAEDEVRPPEGN